MLAMEEVASSCRLLGGEGGDASPCLPLKILPLRFAHSFRPIKLVVKFRGQVARLKSQLESLEAAQQAPAQCPAALAPEERVQLQQKNKTALAKIDTYLSAS